MTEINYSTMLRRLVNDYFDQRVDRVEYFTQRRDILDRIDRDFNGEGGSSRSLGVKELQDGDVTQPQDITRPNPLG